MEQWNSYMKVEKNNIIECFKQCCGSGMFIPDPGSEFYPSLIRIFSIRDPGSASKNLSILNQKFVSKLSEIWSGLFIPDPDFYPSRIQDPGVKKAPVHRSRIRIRNTFSWQKFCIQKYEKAQNLYTYTDNRDMKCQALTYLGKVSDRRWPTLWVKYRSSKRQTWWRT